MHASFSTTSALWKLIFLRWIYFNEHHKLSFIHPSAPTAANSLFMFAQLLWLRFMSWRVCAADVTPFDVMTCLCSWRDSVWCHDVMFAQLPWQRFWSWCCDCAAVMSAFAVIMLCLRRCRDVFLSRRCDCAAAVTTFAVMMLFAQLLWRLLSWRCVFRKTLRHRFGGRQVYRMSERLLRCSVGEPWGWRHLHVSTDAAMR